MANQEHEAILNQGIAVWNQWRKENPKIIPEISTSTIRDADWTNADFAYAKLRSLQFINVNLSGANFTGADLSGGGFIDTNLSDADFFGANLSRRTLKNANLTRADLYVTDLSHAKITDIDLSHAQCGLTVFTEVDLSTARGLDTIRHIRPSVVSLGTIMKSGGKLPEVFLRGCGVSEILIPALMGDVFQFHSCYIIYSVADQDFAHHLYDRLQAAGIRCWLHEHSLEPLPGNGWHATLQNATRPEDKALILCSETALNSRWFENEFRNALTVKSSFGLKDMIIPITLDNSLWEYAAKPQMIGAVKRLEIQKFESWQDSAVFDQAFDQLVNALRVQPE